MVLEQPEVFPGNGCFGDILWNSGAEYSCIYYYAVCNGVYGLSVCEDMQDHEIKNILCRVSLQKYVISKVLVCVIGTIAVYCLGTFLYLAFELTQYPLVSDSGLACWKI